MFKKAIISSLMIGFVALAVASSGGGKKKTESPLKPAFNPVRTTNGFTLRSGPSYAGSQIVSSERNRNYITYNTVVTYQKGNSIYILPHQVRVGVVNTVNPGFKSNLNLLDLRIRLRK